MIKMTEKRKIEKYAAIDLDIDWKEEQRKREEQIEQIFFIDDLNYNISCAIIEHEEKKGTKLMKLLDSCERKGIFKQLPNKVTYQEIKDFYKKSKLDIQKRPNNVISGFMSIREYPEHYESAEEVYEANGVKKPYHK